MPQPCCLFISVSGSKTSNQTLIFCFVCFVLFFFFHLGFVIVRDPMGSGSKWRKAKLALGLNMCLYVPEARDRDSSPSPSSPSSNSTITTTATQPRLSDAVSLSPSGQATSPSSSAHRLSKSGNPKSSKVISRQTHFYFCFCHIILKGYYFYFLFFG